MLPKRAGRTFDRRLVRVETLSAATWQVEADACRLAWVGIESVFYSRAMESLANKVAVITGAGSGIGRGMALAFARAVGEFGSVVFISGNLPFKTEIAPYLIIMRLDAYDYAGAISLAVVLLIISFLMLSAINWLQNWAGRYQS